MVSVELMVEAMFGDPTGGWTERPERMGWCDDVYKWWVRHRMIWSVNV